MTVNPAMITLARESRELTQKQMSDAVGVSQGKISKYEGGLLNVQPEDLEKLAQALGYPVDFFLQKDEVFGFGSPCFYHRKRSSMAIRELRKIQAQLNVFRFRVERLFRGIEIEKDYEFFNVVPDELSSPEYIAQEIRRVWQVPRGPIGNLTALIENAGGIVFHFSFGTKKLDAVSQVTRTFPPIFFVNLDIPADRARFTLAHELGHVIMHRGPSSGEHEVEADRFAAEFMMPSQDIRPSLRRLSFNQLPDLKRIWRMSMASIIRRARDLDQITDHKYKSLNIQMSKQGWKTREEFEFPHESPTLVRDIVSVHRFEHGLSLDELAALTNSSRTEFVDTFAPPTSITSADGRLRVVS